MSPSIKGYSWNPNTLRRISMFPCVADSFSSNRKSSENLRIWCLSISTTSSPSTTKGYQFSRKPCVHFSIPTVASFSWGSMKTTTPRRGLWRACTWVIPIKKTSSGKSGRSPRLSNHPSSEIKITKSNLFPSRIFNTSNTSLANS